MHVVELGSEGSIPSFFCGDGTYCWTYGEFQSKSWIYSFGNYCPWEYDCFLGHLWWSCWSNFCSYLGEISSLGLNLGNMNFSFCFWFCCYYFLNNSATCWGSILPFITTFSYLLYLFYWVFLSSSSLNWDIKIVLLVVLIFSCFSFLRQMCVGFRGLLFLMKLSSYYLFFFCPFEVALLISFSLVILLHLMESISKT